MITGSLASSVPAHQRLTETAALVSAKPDWGDVPAWVGAGVSVLGMTISVLALIFAAKAARAAQDVYKIESERDRISELERKQRHEESLAQQAAKTVCWLERTTTANFGSHKNVPRFDVVIRNASDVPIYDMRAYYCIRNENGKDEGVWQFSEPVVGAAATVKFSAHIKLLMMVGPDAAERGRIAMAFRDSAGIFWWRDGSGNLQRTESLYVPPASPLKEKKVYIQTFTGPAEWTDVKNEWK
ncbi:hypothetical protein [Micromonospora sp. NBC_00858]|uniref:hypothetical protein n=1 Tax=Micromonospora sp. NBC_00858 TaxID=2975979 RepID=UPI00386F93D8|nr:hypothetical protein OG990_30810 [Micromonospora sp. NBC_00858]